LYVILAEECAHCDRTQLQADHVMPLLRQPDHIQTFAAQRNEHPAALSKVKTPPEAGEKPIDFLLVKVGLPVTPALLPECVVATAHGCARFVEGRASRDGTFESRTGMLP